MTPIVVIATHNRLEITSFNIESLLKQSVVPGIVLVVSNLQEKVYYQRKFPIQLVTFPNVPLGGKWQAGVKAAFEMGADPLIILGSDDILSDGYIAYACDLVSRGYDMVGAKYWYIHYKRKAFYCEYLAKQSLGGGRIYSQRALKKINAEVFNPKINRHLDDYIMKRTQGTGIIPYTDPSLVLHAVKGDWPVLNPFIPTHPNIKIISEHDSAAILPGLYL